MNQSVIEVCIANSKQQSFGTWLSLPANKKEIHALFASLDLDCAQKSSWQVVAIKWPLEIRDVNQLSNASINSLNFLSHRLCMFDEQALLKYQAIIAHDEVYSEDILELINLTYNLQGYDFYEGIVDIEQLGKSWIAQRKKSWGDEYEWHVLAQFIDYSALGQAILQANKGSFTNWGAICENEIDFEPVLQRYMILC